MKKAFWFVVFVPFFSSCFFSTLVMPSKEEIDALDYGATPSIDTKQAIKDYMYDTLKDGPSARYRNFSNPFPYWIRLKDGIHAGYAVTVEINAKSTAGGYVGFTPFVVAFRNNKIFFDHEINKDLNIIPNTLSNRKFSKKAAPKDDKYWEY